MTLNLYIDHTKLGPLVSQADVDQLIKEAIKHQFKSICISPIWVSYAKEKLAEEKVLICTVVGFPHGTQTTKVKAFETKQALLDGADEIDMVANVAAIKARDRKTVLKDIKAVVKAAKDATTKVIIETALLDTKEITYVSKLVVKAGATFVKTSTGYSTRGANLADIRTIKKAIGNDAQIKASGGVRTHDDAMAFINAGAARIGTSQGVKLVSKEASDGDTTY